MTALIIAALLLLRPSAPLSETLTLERCLELAAERNLSLRQQEELVAQAAADIAVQRAAKWPRLQFVSSAAYVSELARLEIPLPGAPAQGIEVGARDQYDISLGLSAPVFTGFRTEYLVRSAEENRRSMESDTRRMRNVLFFRIHQLYYALEENLLVQEVLRASARRIMSHLEQARLLLEHAQATGFDTLEVANRLLETETEQWRTHHGYRVLAAELAALLDVPEADSIAPFQPDAEPPPIPPIEEYEAAARAHRPELAAQEHRLRERELQRKAARSSYYPQVSAGASFHYARPGVDFLRNEWMDYYTVGIEIRWELWNLDRRRNELRRIDHAIAISRLDRERIWLDIRREVTAAYEELQSARTQLSLQRRLVGQEEERYRIARDRYERGMATVYELRDAEESLTAAELLLRRDYIDLKTREASMALATGRIGSGGSR